MDITELDKNVSIFISNQCNLQNNITKIHQEIRDKLSFIHDKEIELQKKETTLNELENTLKEENEKLNSFKSASWMNKIYKEIDNLKTENRLLKRSIELRTQKNKDKKVQEKTVKETEATKVKEEIKTKVKEEEIVQENTVKETKVKEEIKTKVKEEEIVQENTVKETKVKEEEIETKVKEEEIETKVKEEEIINLPNYHQIKKDMDNIVNNCNIIFIKTQINHSMNKVINQMDILVKNIEISQLSISIKRDMSIINSKIYSLESSLENKKDSKVIYKDFNESIKQFYQSLTTKMNKIIKENLTKITFNEKEYVFDGKYFYDSKGKALGYKTKKGYKLYKKK